MNATSAELAAYRMLFTHEIDRINRPVRMSCIHEALAPVWTPENQEVADAIAYAMATGGRLPWTPRDLDTFESVADLIQSAIEEI